MRTPYGGDPLVHDPHALNTPVRYHHGDERQPVPGPVHPGWHVNTLHRDALARLNAGKGLLGIRVVEVQTGRVQCDRGASTVVLPVQTEHGVLP